MKLDYSLTSPQDRNELVQKILEENPNPNEKYLEILTDYLINCMEKEERKQKKILTENRLATINKRETSYEGLAESLESGEDGVYNLMAENKNQLFQPKDPITKQDLEDIPPLKQLKEAITIWEQKLKTAEGKDIFVIKKALIEMHKDQYIIKQAYKKPVNTSTVIQTKHYLPLEDRTSELDSEGMPIPDGISLLKPEVCSAILCNYSKLKQDSFDQFEGDLYYLLLAFDDIATTALKDEPLYERLVEYKIDGLQNADIQQKIQEEFGIKYSLEYLSSLWRKKIPKLIAATAEDQWLDNYYLNQEKGKYKRCNKCKEIKLLLPKYFSRNKSSKNGYYSICKKCRKGGN